MDHVPQLSPTCRSLDEARWSAVLTTTTAQPQAIKRALLQLSDAALSSFNQRGAGTPKSTFANWAEGTGCGLITNNPRPAFLS
ncbi:hypothetical protein Zmor_028195 [Zophobas morio]|uniref:Uncharacterized protein n=1 Tax=Zophobas morio TaxID=2755281 RepID=A0AA38HQ30_9CUCU|nr:hypothetical protein Zmor_028195 [Zophobas morio]